MITFLLFVGTILVLVGVHEGGHFLAAKASGVYVEEFAIGFGPKLFSFGKGETKYSIRAIPFGGYVRMAGEDAREALPDIPTDRLLYSKPPLVRIVISLAGPAMNLLTTFLVAVFALWGFGIPVLQVADTIPGKPAASVLQPGDRVYEINGHPVHDIDAVSRLIQEANGAPVDFLIERDGTPEHVKITPTFDEKEGRYLVGAYFLPVTYTKRIKSLDPSSPLALAGLRPGDEIESVNGSPVSTAISFIEKLSEILPADSVSISVLRNGGEIALVLPTAGMTVDKLLTGVEFVDLGKEMRRPGLTAGIVLGAGQFADELRMMGELFHSMITGKISPAKSIAGPIGIARLLGEGMHQGGSVFLWIFSYLSLSLGILNLIPFPALDGSRAAFALYELVARKPIPPEREGMIHLIGFLILLGLMILITFQDIVRLFQ